jgi:hypothetical protein
MTVQKNFIRVFLASPGDLAPEREAISEVVNEINRAIGEANNVYLELVKWETHTRPDFGEDAQDVINRQIGDGYEIFIGLMWGRFGSPTNRAESGTEEEFERAMARRSGSPASVTIMLYFKNAPIAPSEIDPIQIGKVQDFKKRVSKELGGFYHQFDSTDEFASKVRIHLIQLVPEILRRPSQPVGRAQAAASDFKIALSHFNALGDDDYDEGIVELTEKSLAALNALTEVSGKIARANEKLGEKIGHAADEMRAAALAGQAAIADARKRIPNRIADDVEDFVSELLVAVPEFHKQHALAMELFGKLAVIANSELEEPTENFVMVLGTLKRLTEVISTSVRQIQGLKDSMASTPRMTTAYNRARKRAVALLADLISQMEVAVSSTREVESLLEGIIKSRDLP